MVPHLTLSQGATLVQPDISKPIKFVADVATPFTVQAEDGKTQRTYYVTVKLDNNVKASGAELIPSSIQLTDANILRALDVLGMNITVEDGVTKIELRVNAGVDTTALYLKADTSYKATCTPQNEAEPDELDDVHRHIRGQDEHERLPDQGHAEKAGRDYELQADNQRPDLHRRDRQ